MKTNELKNDILSVLDKHITNNNQPNLQSEACRELIADDIISKIMEQYIIISNSNCSESCDCANDH